MVNDIQLYYELHGSPDSPVLVLNNGVIMNAATSWVFQTETFARHYRVLQYDCRGQAQSEHPEERYTMALHAADLAALLHTLAIDRAHIAGISYGGEVAQAFVLEYPHLVRSLILIDTVSEVGPELSLVIKSWIDALRTGDASWFFNTTVPWNFSPGFIQAHPQLLEDARKRYALLDFQAVIRLCECFLEVNFTSRLPEIKAPTCIIVGDLDLIKGRRYAEILRQGIPHSEFHILQNAGHATCWERSAEFNTILLGFLAKQA
jgi:pimeloyl-ACP methyl ester carboxylesterase